MKLLNKKTGSLIAAIRKEQNRTQQDLANELGVSSAAVSKWERGIGFRNVKRCIGFSSVLKQKLERN